MGENKREPYDEVHVLLLGWEHEDDDQHGNKAMMLGLQRLENVFQGFLGYKSYSTWRIPIEAPTDALNIRLREFRDQHNHRRNLLIVYYAGHGATDANRNLSWLWYNNLQHSPRVEWNALQTLFLTGCVADVLLIIDCCNAYSAVRAARTVNPASATLWAACSADTKTPLSGPTSFTENLIALLEDLDSEGMDVEDINTNLVIRMDQIQSWSKLLSPNAPHCVSISLARPHRSIRLKRLLHPGDERLQNRAVPSIPVIKSSPRRSERPGRTTDKQRRESNDRPLDSYPKGDLPDTKTPSDDATEKLERPEAVYLPAEDMFTPRLLEALWDPSLDARGEAISEPARDTSTRIFENQTFMKWLSDLDPILWIQGKPGSGKSTLMKAIASNLSRTGYLPQAQRPPLASHFFWAAGTLMQQSFTGLARHLLYQIIEKAPRAGKHVVSQIGTDLLETLPSVLREIDVADVLVQLFHDPKSPLFGTPWFFLVDGRDECGSPESETDLSMAISLIQDLSRAHGVKVIVASRPYVAIAESFSGAPFLRLQDMTAKDIEAYVRMRLQDLHHSGSFEQELEQMIAQVVRRAEGVFLWVVLIVRGNFHALAAGDTVTQVKEQLNSAPGELADLYSEILFKSRTSLSSRVISLIFASEVETFGAESEAKVQPLLSTTALYFALKTMTTDVIDARIKLAEPELVRLRADEMSKVLQEATRGLIILEERRGETFTWPEAGGTISYLHKSAYDFLNDLNIRKVLEEELGDDFSPQLALLRAMVMQLKAQDHGIVGKYTFDDLSKLRCWPKIEQAMTYAESALDFAPDETMRLLQEMDRVVTYQLTKWSDGSLNHHWSEFLPLGGQRTDDERSTFLSFVTSCGLHTYLRVQYERGLVPKNKPGRPLLDYAIHPQPQFKGLSRNSSTVKCLLDNGADPNEPFAGQTVYYRLSVMSYRRRNENLQTDWSQELKVMEVSFRARGAYLSGDQIDALQEEDGVTLSQEEVERLSHQPGSTASSL